MEGGEEGEGEGGALEVRREGEEGGEEGGGSTP